MVPESSSVRVLTSGRWNGSSGATPAGGQTAQAVRDGVDGRERALMMEQRHFEEDPEPGDEEHHLEGDEQHHAVAQADGDHRGVVALVGLDQPRRATTQTMVKSTPARPIT